MLYDINKKQIQSIPHKAEYNRWRDRLSNNHYFAIMNRLEEILNTNEVQTSSFVPGNDWTGTVFQQIYEEACNNNEKNAGLFFGLLMWEAVMNHPANWSFVKSEKVQGTVYFKIEL